MFDVLSTVLYPIVSLMRGVLGLYYDLSGSMGLSILLLSFTFVIVLLPLGRMAERLESRIRKKVEATSAEVRDLKKTLKGEALFLATERVYKKHGYHPIQSIGLGLSFIAMLPVLVSAIILLDGTDMLAGHSFLMIDDLSRPDQLAGPVNIMPLLMSGVTVVDAHIRYRKDPSSRNRFLCVAVVLLLLVYNLASGLVLYWIGSNMLSMLLSIRWKHGGAAKQT